MKKIDVGILGGDDRQLELINSLYKEGHNLYITGFDKAISQIPTLNYNIQEMLNKSNYVVLPIPVSRDEIYFNTPFSEFKTPINGCVAQMTDKKIFCFDSNKITKICPNFSNCKYYDFAKNEKFILENAKITAECAIELAEKELTVGNLKNANVLICGFGRIGKHLVNLLTTGTARLTATARQAKHISQIKERGVNAIYTQDLKETSGFDIIFNTIPYQIFNEDTLKTTAKNALIIDLASAPGGVDMNAAEKANVKVIQASGLPGKMAPNKSANLIKDTILEVIEANVL